MCATYRLAKYINAYTPRGERTLFLQQALLSLRVLLFGGIHLCFRLVGRCRFPQLLTVFGILALFTLCLVAFCLYFSLLTIEYRCR